MVSYDVIRILKEILNFTCEIKNERFYKIRLLNSTNILILFLVFG